MGVVMSAMEQTWEIPLFALGSCIGSFLNVCITRLPRGESILFPASRCRACDTQLPGWANIPLLSYILLRARCTYCRAPISLRYFLVELCTAVLAVTLYDRFGPGPLFCVYLVFVAALVVAAFIDLEAGIIPDVISVSGIALGFVLSWTAPALLIQGFPSPLSSLLGALFGGGFLSAVAWGYRALTGRDGMGGGDVKLLAMIGAFVGWNGIPGTLFSAALMGSLWGLGLMAVKRGISSTYPLPFAPFLSLGALVHVL